jgi:hypothetical protein
MYNYIIIQLYEELKISAKSDYYNRLLEFKR